MIKPPFQMFVCLDFTFVGEKRSLSLSFGYSTSIKAEERCSRQPAISVSNPMQILIFFDIYGFIFWLRNLENIQVSNSGKSAILKTVQLQWGLKVKPINTDKGGNVFFINTIIPLHATSLVYDKPVTFLWRRSCYTVEEAIVTHLRWCEHYLKCYSSPFCHHGAASIITLSLGFKMSSIKSVPVCTPWYGRTISSWTFSSFPL